MRRLFRASSFSLFLCSGRIRIRVLKHGSGSATLLHIIHLYQCFWSAWQIMRIRIHGSLFRNCRSNNKYYTSHLFKFLFKHILKQDGRPFFQLDQNIWQFNYKIKMCFDFLLHIHLIHFFFIVDPDSQAQNMRIRIRNIDFILIHANWSEIERWGKSKRYFKT